MRIISGSARGRKLAGFNGNSIRPTSDRVREAVFSSILSQIGQFTDIAVLDLYAGTGAMGIEALSRGASRAVFVDQSRESGGLIEKNLTTTSLGTKGVIRQGKVLDIIRRLGEESESFDLIIVDPPYADSQVEEILQAVNHFGLLQTDGIICFETSESIHIPGQVGPLTCTDRRKYGSTAVSYFSSVDNGDEVE